MPQMKIGDIVIQDPELAGIRDRLMAAISGFKFDHEILPSPAAGEMLDYIVKTCGPIPAPSWAELMPYIQTGDVIGFSYGQGLIALQARMKNQTWESVHQTGDAYLDGVSAIMEDQGLGISAHQLMNSYACVEVAANIFDQISRRVFSGTWEGWAEIETDVRFTLCQDVDLSELCLSLAHAVKLQLFYWIADQKVDPADLDTIKGKVSDFIKGYVGEEQARKVLYRALNANREKCDECSDRADCAWYQVNQPMFGDKTSEVINKVDNICLAISGLIGVCNLGDIQAQDLLNLFCDIRAVSES